jgi:hypothetical protein
MPCRLVEVPLFWRNILPPYSGFKRVTLGGLVVIMLAIEAKVYGFKPSQG